jgi:hypothetical protein
MPQKCIPACGGFGAESALPVREYHHCEPSLAPVPEKAQSLM